MKKRMILIILTAVLACSAAGCSDKSTDNTAQAAEATTKSSNSSEWDDTTTLITLNEDSVSIEGSGAEAKDGIVTIGAAGTYVVSGTLSEGQIIVNATKTENVELILNGINLTNPTGAPVYAAKVAKLTVTLASGSENVLTDGGSNFQYADTAEEEPDAALFSKNDLTINGTGTLTIHAGYKNGIGAKDNLMIESGTLTVEAANNALRGTDSVIILDGTLNLTADNDGIQTGTNLDGKGNISLEGGKVTIISGHDGIQSDNSLTASGGEYIITTGSGASAEVSDTTESYKGVKASAELNISGGTFIIDSSDDTIHAGGNISISDGTFTLSSGDDGIHSDADLNISGGEITTPQSYEALEGNNVYISGGTLDLTASDDGINAAGGSSNGTEADGGAFGGDQFSAGGDHTLDISGGTIKFTAGGDGLDSNNTINISDGTVIAIINSSADNSALDSDGEVTITGGTVFAGGTGTFESISESSTQSYVYLSDITAAAEITILSDNQTLASYTADDALSQLVIFAPGITSGVTYEVANNGQSSAITAGTGGGSSRGGMNPPGGMR